MVFQKASLQVNLLRFIKLHNKVNPADRCAPADFFVIPVLNQR
jgi:hypothetical protein